MSFINNVCFLSKIIYSRLFRISKPYIIQFSVTNRCNARCSYCYAKYYERKSDELSTEAIFEIIDKLAKSGTCWISLVGGEPYKLDPVPSEYFRYNGDSSEVSEVSLEKAKFFGINIIHNPFINAGERFDKERNIFVPEYRSNVGTMIYNLDGTAVKKQKEFFLQ